MTCVVALKYDNKIYMGADSLFSDHNYICYIPSGPPKLIKKNGFLIGFSGSPQYQNEILTNSNILPKNKTEEEMGTYFYNYLTSKQDKHSYFLLSAGKSIIFVASNGWIKYNDYYAIGSAYPIALGSLYSTSKILGMPAHDRLKTALEAATKFCTVVKEPFIFESI